MRICPGQLSVTTRQPSPAPAIGLPSLSTSSGFTPKNGRVALPGSYWFGPAEEKPDGGESFVDLVDRVRPAIVEQTRAHEGRDIVSVAHGGSIRAAIAVALDLSPQAVLAFGIENCALTRLDHYKGANGEGWRVVMINHQPWSASHGSIHLQPSTPERRAPDDEVVGVQA